MELLVVDSQADKGDATQKLLKEKENAIKLLKKKLNSNLFECLVPNPSLYPSTIFIVLEVGIREELDLIIDRHLCTICKS